MVPLLCDRSESRHWTNPAASSVGRHLRTAARRLLCGAVGKGIRRIARDLGVGTVLRRNFPETIYFPLDGTHDHARWFLKKGPYPRGRRLTILGVSGLGARALTVEPDGLASDGLKGVPSSDFANMRLSPSRRAARPATRCLAAVVFSLQMGPTRGLKYSIWSLSVFQLAAEVPA
jgi:hypothetical protein